MIMKNTLATYGFGLNDPIFDLWLNEGNERKSKNAISMRTDIREEGEDYVLETELPGVDKKDVHINIDNNGYLTIEASRSQNMEETNNSYLHKERSWGMASRSFYVGDIDEKTVNAKMENGILTLRFPKEQKVEKGRKEISIQ